MMRGIRVVCAVCGVTKKPHGRSAAWSRTYCDESCPGYKAAPQVGCLWPGETSAEFGYHHCSAGTEVIDEVV